MSANGNGLVQRLWSYCNVLRDDGLSYGDYLEQLTYLLFLKMADEQTRPPFSRPAFVPEELSWPSLLARDGDDLEVHYRHVLTELGRRRRDVPASARDRRGGRREPDHRRRRAEGRPGRPLRDGADQPAVRQEVVDDRCERRGRDGARGPRHRPRRLLGLDLEQAAQL